MNNILVTGASGFIGNALSIYLNSKEYNLRLAVRLKDSLPKIFNQKFNVHEVGNIDGNTNWKKTLLGVECIIHCASRAHVIKDTELNSLEIYRKINVEGTQNLAIQAKKYGVRRFIYISSIGVNGVSTEGTKKFTNKDLPSPSENYAISKWEAEKCLKKISSETGLEVVIIRPPLVYGPGVKGNFLRLLDLVNSGLPLPLDKIDNKRSILGLDNLIDFIECCIKHPKASGKTFLVSDNINLSTSVLIKKISIEMGKSSYIFYVPIFILKFFAMFTKKSKEINRLLSSLQIESEFTYQVLGWKPPFDVDKMLKNTIDWYLDRK